MKFIKNLLSKLIPHFRPSLWKIQDAMEKGKMNQMLTYLQSGTPVTVVDRRGVSLLERAIEYKSLPVLAYIIAQDPTHHSLISLYKNTAQKGNTELFQSIIKLDHHADKRNKLIFESIEYKETALFKTLLETGLYHSQLQNPSIGGKSLIAEVLLSGNIDLVKHYEDHFVQRNDPTIPRDLLGKALRATVFYANQKAFTTYLNAPRININACDRYGRTALHLAVEHYSAAHKDIIRMLLEKNAHVNARDKHGKTPLHYALTTFVHQKEASWVIEKLLISGADLESIDKHGESPFSLAAKQGTSANLKTLCSFWLVRNPESDPAIRKEALRTFLKNTLSSVAHSQPLENIIEQAAQEMKSYQIHSDIYAHSTIDSVTKRDLAKAYHQATIQYPHLPAETYRQVGTYIGLIKELSVFKHLSKETARDGAAFNQSNPIILIMHSLKPDSLSEREFRAFCRAYFTSSPATSSMKKPILTVMERVFKEVHNEFNPVHFTHEPALTAIQQQSVRAL